MSKAAKIVVTVIVLFVFFLLFSLVVGVRAEAGNSTPGILGLILFFGVIYAVRAIWKSGKDNKNDGGGDGSSILQK